MNKKDKLSDKLTSVQKNIDKTKRLIEYHKKMLRIYQRKEAELMEKLERAEFDALYKEARNNGCDIKALDKAIRNGDFSTDPENDIAAADTDIKKGGDVSCV